MNERIKDILERALKTFVQAALAVLIPTMIAYFNGVITEFSVPVIVYPALAAGFSAVWNAFFPTKAQKNSYTNEDSEDK